jgi:hypothetical protein
MSQIVKILAQEYQNKKQIHQSKYELKLHVLVYYNVPTMGWLKFHNQIISYVSQML